MDKNKGGPAANAVAVAGEGPLDPGSHSEEGHMKRGSFRHRGTTAAGGEERADEGNEMLRRSIGAALSLGIMGALRIGCT